MEWIDVYSPTCEDCKKNRADPPCVHCKTELFPENIPISEVYLTVRNQTCIGPNKVIDLSLPGVFYAFLLHGVPKGLWKKYLLRIRMVFYHFLRKAAENNAY